MYCTQEEIAKKREQALQRQNQKALLGGTKTTVTPTNANNYTNQNYTSYSSGSSSKNFGNNAGQYGNKFPTRKNFQNKIQSAYKQQSMSNRYNPIAAANTNTFYGTPQKVCEVTFTLISSSRFSADTSIYQPKVIELFKGIPSKLYDPKTKIWNFHLSDYTSLCEKLISMKSEVSFKALPSFLLTIFRKQLQEEGSTKVIDISRIDKSLMNALYPFQKEGIEYGISKNGRCLIADDMGLGKTRQALGIAHYYKDDWPLIIITPSSVRYQWSEAIIENLSSVPVQSIQHVITTKDCLEKSQITILSYDLLVRRIDEISSRKYGVVICDESHYLKSAKTQRTKAVQRLAKNAKRIILLTGTPALSRPIELHSQMKIVMPTFMSYQDFGMRYCAGVVTKFGCDFSGSSNLKELELMLRACCLIRRLKSDVMTQLPSKLRQKIILDPHLIKASTKEMEEASKNMTKTSMNGVQKHSALLQYYSETSKAKQKAVCNYVTDLIENEQKFLIFAHHQNMIDAIANLLTSKKILFIRIDGKTNPEQRKHFVDTFQRDQKVLVALLSITAANAGITMTAAQLVIFAELSWNPGILCQAEDRVHRIGQTDNVVIRYLLAKETADDYLWPAIQKKIDVLNEAGLDQNFDLGEANIENQVLHNQQKLDVFLENTSPNAKSTNTPVDATGNASLHTSTDSLKDLLDIDDDAFDNIDLDNIA